MPRKTAPPKTATIVWKFADGRDFRQPLLEFVRQQRHAFEAMKYSDNPRLRIEGEQGLKKMDQVTAQAMRERAARSKPKMDPKAAVALAALVKKAKTEGITRGTIAKILRELQLKGHVVDRATIKARIEGK